MYRFFNAGHKIDENFPFSLPGDVGADIHVLGRWNLLAPKEGWFEVPRELTVGNSIIAVQFYKDIQRRFGKRGIVLLDANYNPDTEDPDKPLEFYAVAPTEELVIARAEKLWLDYLEAVCKAHFEDVQNAMSAGGAPRGARGFTAHALKLRGYADPAERYFLAQKEGQQGKVPGGMPPEMVGIVAQMQQQNQLMMSIMLALVSGEKIDPELLKKGMQRADDVPPANGKPVGPSMPPENAGTLEVEGQGQTSLEQRISRKTVEYETLNTKPADKKNRAAAASKQL